MRRIQVYLVLATMFSCTLLNATEHYISGKITDEKGKGLPGANIIVEGSGLGASTNLSGDYSIDEIPSGTYKFKVSMMGYESTYQEITVVSDQEISFRLLPKAFKGQPVVVTASRTHQKLQDSPVSTSVVEAEMISERNFLSADEAMRFVGGVTMSDDQVSIRNSTGYAKGVGSRVLVMLDGVPILAGDTGEIKWDALPIGQIEQMEIVKSGGSALYGSNAMGGVINFITKKADKNNYKITSEFGVWDKPAYEAWEWTSDMRAFHRIALEHSRTAGKWGILLSAEEKQDQGFKQATDFIRGQFFGKATRNINGASKLSFMTNVAYEDRGSALIWKNQANALEVDESKQDDRVWSSKVQFHASYDGSKEGGKKLWNMKTYTNFYKWIDKLANSSGGHDRHYSASNKTGFEGQYTFLPLENHRFVTGGEISYTSLDATMFGNRTGFGGALFAQDEISSLNPVVLTAGLRGDLFKVNETDDYEGELYAQINPKLGAVYHLKDNIAFRGSFGSGFRMPTMAELFTEVSIAGILRVQPNPYLQAEQSYSFETGFNWIDGNQMFDVALFNNWYSNMIEPVTVVGTEVQFRNIQDATIFGVEASYSFNLGDVTDWAFNDKVTEHLSKASITTNYLYTKAINRTETESLDEIVVLPYRPENTFNISAAVDYWEHASLAIDARYQSPQKYGLYPEDESVDQRVIDLTHNLNWNSWTLQFKVSNLLNWNYTEIERTIAPIRHYSLSLSVDI